MSHFILISNKQFDMFHILSFSSYSLSWKAQNLISFLLDFWNAKCWLQNILQPFFLELLWILESRKTTPHLKVIFLHDSHILRNSIKNYISKCFSFKIFLFPKQRVDFWALYLQSFWIQKKIQYPEKIEFFYKERL